MTNPKLRLAALIVTLSAMIACVLISIHLLIVLCVTPSHTIAISTGLEGPFELAALVGGLFGFFALVLPMYRHERRRLLGEIEV